jgi:riboflavin synthase
MNQELPITNQESHLMFTGIIEAAGTITKLEHEGDNVHFTVQSTISNEPKIDQSLAHDGVCLTVIALTEDTHTVTAIRETMDRTRLGEWNVGNRVNLERAMQAGARLDGHIVQGHVDTVGECLDVAEAGGSWYFTFRYKLSPETLLVDKGSVCINGVSLTVVEPVDDTFKVAIIPYTYEFTNFNALVTGKKVNLEFDIIGKYIARQMLAYQR